jgi:hypothetical protein
MATPDAETRALYNRLQEVLGNEHADTLMSYLPPEPWTDLAKKSDIAGLEARLDQRFEKIDQRFEKIDQRFEKLEQRLEGRFQTLDDRLFEMQGRLNDQFKNYSVVMVAAMTALTAIYAGLLTIIA